MFLMSMYETVAFGLSENLSDFERLDDEEQISAITDKAKKLWEDPNFQKNSGAGVRGTTRLSNLLPMAKDFFKP